MNNIINLGTFNWDASTNDLNMNLADEFFNTLPLPLSRPSLLNRTINFNPFTEWGGEQAFMNSFSQRNAYKKVADDKSIETIKRIKYKKDFEQKECPIMMTEFKEGEEISQLPCNHLFGTDAITRWLKNENYKCPVCRYEMNFKEVKIHDTSDNDLSDISWNDLLDLSNNDLSGVGGLNGLSNLSNNDFERLLINMIQGEIRRAAPRYTNSFNSFIQEVETNLDNSYDEEFDDQLQQALWASMNNGHY